MPPLNYADWIGTRYTPPPRDPTLPPQVKEIPVPMRAEAIWGSTGRDASGHIWFGVSNRGDGASARLFEYTPDTQELVDRGNVVDELKQTGIHRNGEGQIKIHTKNIPVADGYLYFGSFDEEGEDPGKGIEPKWGGHIWRLWPTSRHWEHLRAVPQGIVAVAGNGNWVYALGYWDHVLFQYDVRRGSWRQVKVGSVREHPSHNFVVDSHGHGYVPRAREWRPGEATSHPGKPFSAELAEFDTDLKEVGRTPLHYYAADRDSHGLIGLSYFEDGSIVVSTQIGPLSRITLSESAAAKVDDMGWVHPTGQSYSSALFPIDGKRYLAAATRTDWVIYDLAEKKGQARKLPFNTSGALLYGSSTRDNNGRFYIVGSQPQEPRSDRPLILQVELQN